MLCKNSKFLRIFSSA